MSTATIDSAGCVVLPAETRNRYHLNPATEVRVIETRHGLLLVPLTGAPMSAELQRELAEWQSLDASGLDAFPYQETT
jgi:bifunctional DNA-binding transcriptional regulator/antitoxin component of YhaV-PrlF toxin-antitoxin module